MSHHPPFKQVEASRPDFDATTETYHVTKTPAPDWEVATGGSGREDLPGVKEGLWKGDGGTYREIDPATANTGSLYKMMISAITPRPIGFVSSISATGETNLAPFSYFNMASHNPPTVFLSFTHPNPETLKETCSNILDTKQFTVNIISEPFVEAANFTSIDAPRDVSEWDLSGLTPVKSKLVRPARVGESAFSMECELEHFHHLYTDDQKRTGTVVLGRVKLFHARDDVIRDDLLVDTGKLQPVSRLGGITYGRTTSTYEAPRPVWANEKDRDEVKAALANAEKSSQA